MVTTRAPGAPRPGGRMRIGAVVFLAGVLATAAGCDAAGDPTGWTVRELPSPAGAGSGEASLAEGADGVLLSWLQPVGEGEHALFLDRWNGESWSGRRSVAAGPDYFVNWADFPSVVETRDGVLAAHWLVRGEEGGYDYGIRAAFSRDGGRSWSEPWTPHEDGTPTEHGFVSFLDLGPDGIGLAWLDGRAFAAGESGPPDDPEMSLRFRRTVPDGEPSPERLLDGRTCECCQTDAALTSRGAVVVYRDRSEEEVRDVSIVRRTDGGWSEPRPVHRDGWVFPACPVNGPAVAARGERVAVAWFTGAGDIPRVQLAFSADAGMSFGEPVRIDDGNPAGRVDVAILDDGSAVVSWLERAGGSAEVRIRTVLDDGRRGPATSVGSTADGRSSGFPRMARGPRGDLLLAWTDSRDGGSRVRIARASPARSPSTDEQTR